jgi:hypothetical protein
VHYSFQQLSSTVLLDGIHQGSHVTPKPKDQVISLTKQLVHLAQTKSLESVDSEMQSPAYRNEEVSQLAAATSLSWLAEIAVTPVRSAGSSDIQGGLQAQLVR